MLRLRISGLDNCPVSLIICARRRVQKRLVMGR